MKYRFSLLILSIFLAQFAHAQVLESPTEFLGVQYGHQFTAHHQLVGYFQYLSDNSDKMKLVQYGKTNEGRPLYVAIVSSKENLKQVESIRLSNLYNAGMEEEKPASYVEKSIVWLSYSVHGNEPGGSESSMNVAYELLKGGTKIDGWLEDVVVIIDPSLNPDGYSRYTHWVRSVSGAELHPELTDVEHMEPWPGGRVNHYLFDLNRDWAWQSQIETQQRIQEYNKWMPHIHADLHEMGYDDHYYFAPAAEPYHNAITDWQRKFQVDIGKNHAKYFDEAGWLYFTGEIFDLLYPSYGDTWPIFNGSIGMTYEQAGHGMSGRSIRLGNGKDLVLQDRIDHHSATSLSTIESAAKRQRDVVSNFKDYFSKSISSPIGEHKHYIVKKGQLSDEFAELLNRNAIDFQYVEGGTKNIRGSKMGGESNTKFDIEAGDIYITAFQAKSSLLQIFMEESAELSDSVTYDITAWNIPMAYGLHAYGLSTEPNVNKSPNKPKVDLSHEVGSYGYAIRWNESFKSKKFLSQALKEGIKVKTIKSDIKFESIDLYRGDLVVLKFDQQDFESVSRKSIELASNLEINIIPLNSGFSESGSDLGGSGLQRIKKPKVLTIFGDGVSANSYGQVWNYFENIIGYPISRVDVKNLSGVDFSDFTTIILPDGYYSLSESSTDNLHSWIQDGGKLIAIAGGIDNLKSSDKFGIGQHEDGMKTAIEEKREERQKRDRLRTYEGAERRSIAGSIPGAIIRTEIDRSHPLCYGLDEYFTLKNSSSRYPYLEGRVYNPIRIPQGYVSHGFIGSAIKNNLSETFVFGEELIGSGTVIYMVDNPLFRAFWKNGEVIFANALFQVQ